MEDVDSQIYDLRAAGVNYPSIRDRNEHIGIIADALRNVARSGILRDGSPMPYEDMVYHATPCPCGRGYARYRYTAIREDLLLSMHLDRLDATRIGRLTSRIFIPEEVSKVVVFMRKFAEDFGDSAKHAIQVLADTIEFGEHLRGVLP